MLLPMCGSSYVQDKSVVIDSRISGSNFFDGKTNPFWFIVSFSENVRLDIYYKFSKVEEIFKKLEMGTHYKPRKFV